MTRGDVVELDWPFSDLTGSKRRPAVVVQADYLNGLIDDPDIISRLAAGSACRTAVLIDDRGNSVRA